jgi:hypothetical protein
MEQPGRAANRATMGRVVLTALICLIGANGMGFGADEVHKIKRPLPQAKEQAAVRRTLPVTVQTPTVTFTGIDWSPPVFPPFATVTVNTQAVTFTGIDWSPPVFPPFATVTVNTAAVTFTGVGWVETKSSIRLSPVTDSKTRRQPK